MKVLLIAGYETTSSNIVPSIHKDLTDAIHSSSLHELGVAGTRKESFRASEVAR